MATESPIITPLPSAKLKIVTTTQAPVLSTIQNVLKQKNIAPNINLKWQLTKELYLHYERNTLLFQEQLFLHLIQVLILPMLLFPILPFDYD